MGFLGLGSGKTRNDKTERPQEPAPQLSEQSLREIEEKTIEVLRTVFDPEIPVNIYELGLVYEVNISQGGDALVRMTLTSPMCPVAGSLPAEVEYKVLSIPGVRSARVELVWDPPWSPDRMTEAARLQLGMF